MTPLRWLGFVLGAALLAFAIERRRKLFRGDVVLLGGLAVLVMVVAATGWSGSILTAFGFHRGADRHILGVVVFACALLLVLTAAALARTSTLSRSLGTVLEALAAETLRQEGLTERFAGHIAIVIPAYEEADNLGPVLSAIPAEVAGLPTAVLLVDDGSRDRTAAVARANGAIVARHIVNRGQGAAMRTGYSIIARTEAPITVAMDSDGQHRPDEMERLVRPLLDGTVDLVNGSRTLPGASAAHIGVMRDVGLLFFSRLISVLTRTRITDCSNGYRAMRTAILPRLDLRQNQFHNSEFLIEAMKAGAVSTEVPVTVDHRLSGRSKKPDWLRYGWGFTLAIVRTWLR
jgi:hypothetical protein